MQFAAAKRSTADNIANIAFVAGDVNKAIGLARPEVYLKKLSADVLASQCIPKDVGLWAIDHAEEFWTSRREMLANSFNDFAQKCLPQRRLAS